MHDATRDGEILHREIAQLRAAAAGAERKLRAIDAVAAVLADEGSADAGVPRILAGLGQALGCAIASYWAPGDSGLERTARWTADGIADPIGPPRGDDSPGAGLAERVWTARSALGIADVAADRELPDHGALIAAGIRSGLGFPVTLGGDVVGVVELYTRRHEPLAAPLVDVFATLGARLGQFLRRAGDDARARLLHAEREREHSLLEQLHAAGRKIAAELVPGRLAQTVIDAATDLTGAEIGAMFYSFHDGRIGNFMLHALAGVPRERFADLPMPRNTALLAPALLGQAAIRVADVTADARYGKNYPYRGVPDGHPPVRSYLAVPVVSRSGAPIGALFLGHAAPGVFTERAERAVIELAAYAAAAMDSAQRYADGQRLTAELDQANAELDQFAYAASHDLRAPLRGITNLATWIDEDLPATTDATTREHLRMLELRAARMDRMIDGLLEFARVGRAHPSTERVDVTALLHETIELTNPRAASRIMMIGEMPMLIAERAALQQVFQHLISNALQHAGRDDVVIRISAIDRGDDWELAVEDNGVGIPPEHRARVWRVFETLTSRDLADTTGIGLAIVKKQVERQGGRAWIDPEATVGTTIRFTWPKRVK